MAIGNGSTRCTSNLRCPPKTDPGILRVLRSKTIQGGRHASAVLEQWAHQHAITLHVIDPGKPGQNAFCESFHSRFRDECLNEHWFLSLEDARPIVEAWRDDDNRTRPHRSLGYRTPEDFRREVGGTVVGW